MKKFIPTDADTLKMDCFCHVLPKGVRCRWCVLNDKIKPQPTEKKESNNEPR